MNIGKRGVPIIAMLPIIRPIAAKGCSLNTLSISPTFTLPYCLWIIPAEKKSRALTKACANVKYKTQNMLPMAIPMRIKPMFSMLEKAINFFRLVLTSMLKLATPTVIIPNTNKITDAVCPMPVGAIKAYNLIIEYRPILRTALESKTLTSDAAFE